MAERTVTNLLARYEELVALHLANHARLRERLASQGHVILARDGLQPDVGQEVLWVLRDCLSGEVLLARSLLSASQKDLAGLLREVQQSLPVPIHGVISDGQHSIRNAVRVDLPDVPHQLCHFHYFEEMAQMPTSSETLTTMIATFRKVRASYWSGLFHCYDMADLPRTHNDLEQYFGSARYHERRSTGRKVASPGLVVRGAVRIVASVATRLHHFCATELQPADVVQWYTLRDELDMRQQSRRMQFRFRRDPDGYLATRENKLLQLRLPP